MKTIDKLSQWDLATIPDPGGLSDRGMLRVTEDNLTALWEKQGEIIDALNVLIARHNAASRGDRP